MEKIMNETVNRGKQSKTEENRGKQGEGNRFKEGFEEIGYFCVDIKEEERTTTRK
jgi:hypothetical protein